MGDFSARNANRREWKKCFFECMTWEEEGGKGIGKMKD